MTVHNNDRVDNTPGDSESQALLLDLPLNQSGDYVIASGAPFLPQAPVVLYEQDPLDPFFSTPFMGSAQRLGNGNVLITLSLSRTLVEVDTTGQIVWEETIRDGGNFIFKSQSYPIGYPGFQVVFDKPLLGDVNIDGVVDFDDIPPFITILISGDFLAEADTDDNGVVDFDDIPGFIAILVAS